MPPHPILLTRPNMRTSSLSHTPLANTINPRVCPSSTHILEKEITTSWMLMCVPTMNYQYSDKSNLSFSACVMSLNVVFKAEALAYLSAFFYMDYLLQEPKYSHLKFVWGIAPIWRKNSVLTCFMVILILARSWAVCAWISGVNLEGNFVGKFCGSFWGVCVVLAMSCLEM